ncbi:hypothetical protein KAU33_05590 [Candidatus Dependentiae bacterium]|nr:hypothetical protein [Candidatus Dependentiae bacterium]
MKKRNKVFVFLFVSVLLMFNFGCATIVLGSEGSKFTGNINVFLGSKALPDPAWKPVESQNEQGFNLNFKMSNWPISVQLEYLQSSKKGELYGIDFEGSTQELNIGILKFYGKNPEKFTYFLGAGFSQISIELDYIFHFTYAGDIKTTIEGSQMGIWASGGLMWILYEHINLGLELKVSTAKISINEMKVNGSYTGMVTGEIEGGGFHFGAFVGYHF